MSCQTSQRTRMIWRCNGASTHKFQSALRTVGERACVASRSGPRAALLLRKRLGNSTRAVPSRGPSHSAKHQYPPTLRVFRFRAHDHAPVEGSVGNVRRRGSFPCTGDRASNDPQMTAHQGRIGVPPNAQARWVGGSLRSGPCAMGGGGGPWVSGHLRTRLLRRFSHCSRFAAQH